jgi:hypothetical protein
MNSQELKRSLKLVIKANLVALVRSAPGCGKSTIIKDIAKELDMDFLDVRLAQMEAVDLGGLVYPDKEGITFSHLPLDLFPLKEIHRKPEKPVLILLDELTSCAPDVQVSAYRLILDRQIGNYNLHNNVYLVAAGNRETDNAVVNPMSSALVSRMVHLNLDVDNKSWIKWASNNDIDSRIIAFINYSGLLSTFDKFEKQDTLTYATPRTYEMLSKLVKPLTKVDWEYGDLIQGTVGSEAGSSFISFCNVYNDIPSYSEIVANPEKIEISERGDTNIAIVSMLNHSVNRKDIDAVVTYVKRLNLEYQTVFFQTLTYNNKLLLVSQCVRKWIKENSDLFDM